VNRVRAHQVTVGGHELDRRDAVRLKAVRACEPAHAAAERVAGDADVGRGAVQTGETQLREPRADALPLDARADAHSAGAGVDRDLVEPGHVHEQASLLRAKRAGVVAGRLRRDPQPALARELDGRDDVALVRREDDGVGPLFEQRVERLAGGVPVAVAGGDGVAGHDIGE
jgi:hypothetical protein